MTQTTTHTTAIDRRRHRIAIRVARLFDGAGTPIRADPLVVVEDGHFASVAFGLQAAAPPDAEPLELPGASLLPGLVDVHVHLAFDAGLDPVGTLAGRDDAAVLDAMADTPSNSSTFARPFRGIPEHQRNDTGDPSSVHPQVSAIPPSVSRRDYGRQAGALATLACVVIMEGGVDWLKRSPGSYPCPGGSGNCARSSKPRSQRARPARSGSLWGRSSWTWRWPPR
ncbi:hypothetical protein [Pseudonocardia sp. GCM10023141]|uniref:hypothetical protein n=1 Tax=Pseudonocardia sp. GCM10023141 TaxID=3252653 RepID=UPI00360F431C